MTHYEWAKPGYGEAVLAADVAEGVTAELYVGYQDGLQVELIVRGEGVRGVMGRHASTNRSQDWPEVERYIPREEWPEEIYAGVRGPDVRTPDEAVVKAVAEARADWEEAFREADEMEAAMSGD
jgi:hypothetical protein|nr:MAG TPA: hypothetical protein [Caudoviricetes sp.]